MITKAKKEKIIEQLKEYFDKSEAVFLTNLVGLPANDSTELRRKVREQGGAVVVTRNTLFLKAVEGKGYESLAQGLKGPHAMAFAFEDVAGIAKVIYDIKQNHDFVTLEKGILGEKILDEGELKTLATLPGKDQLLAMSLATMMAPVSSLARVLHAIKEQKEEVEA